MADDIIDQLKWLRDEFYDVDGVTAIVELAADEIAGLREQLRTANGMLEAANYEVARLAIDLRDCRRGITRG